LTIAGNPTPPQRKHEHEKVGAHQPFLLAYKLGGEAAGAAGVELLRLIVEACGVGVGGEIVPSRYRIESFAIEIRDLDAVPGRREGAHRRVLQGGRKRRGLRVSIHHQDLHASHLAVAAATSVSRPSTRAALLETIL
jgi:hypothetical protein